MGHFQRINFEPFYIRMQMWVDIQCTAFGMAETIQNAAENVIRNYAQDECGFPQAPRQTILGERNCLKAPSSIASVMIHGGYMEFPSDVAIPSSDVEACVEMAVGSYEMMLEIGSAFSFVHDAQYVLVTEAPTESPTNLPTLAPIPTAEPTAAPTDIPTQQPTASPSSSPSSAPSSPPSAEPTSASPTAEPTTDSPTAEPTRSPVFLPKTTAINNANPLKEIPVSSGSSNGGGSEGFGFGVVATLVAIILVLCCLLWFVARRRQRRNAEYRLHREYPVEVEDPKPFGHNYYSHSSASDQESLDPESGAHGLVGRPWGSSVLHTRHLDQLCFSSEDILSEPALDNYNRRTPQPSSAVPEQHPMNLDSLVHEDAQEEEFTEVSASLGETEDNEHEISPRRVPSATLEQVEPVVLSDDVTGDFEIHPQVIEDPILFDHTYFSDISSSDPDSEGDIVVAELEGYELDRGGGPS